MRVMCGEQAQVIEHHIAQHHAERRRRANQLAHHIAPDVKHFGHIARLRVAEDKRTETVWLALRVQRKVHRRWQRSRRGHAAVAHGNRTVRLMHIIKAGHIVFRDGQCPPARLNHEQNRVVVHRQPIASLRVGLDHLALIGDQHIRDARLARVADAVAVAVVEHHACGDLLRPRADHQRQ
jgi:hypothetical protein